MSPSRIFFTLLLGSGVSVLAGCVMTPHGTDAERQRLSAASQPFEVPFEQRQLPELPPQPTWQEVLHRAFLANGDLEAAYFEWKAAMQRIDMAGTYPNSNLSLGFEYAFNGENMKGWDRTTVTIAPDAMQNLSLPNKVMQAARIKLQDARAAGSRFQAKKFEIQQKVLTQYLDYSLMAEQVRIQRDNVGLLKLLTDTAGERVRAGAPQQDLLKAQIEYRMAENELATMESRLEVMRAMLNGMLARNPDEPLAPPASLPEPRSLPVDDAKLIAIATDANPELATLAHQVAGRRDAIELAKMQYLPDINPSAGFTGSIEQFIGAMVVLPTTLPMIRAQIRETRAMLAASQAMLRQTSRDRAASFVAALYALRNSERQAQFFREVVLPKSEQVLKSSRESYAAGAVGFIELIDSQRTLLEVRRLIAEVRIDREKRLAELETLAGLDFERLAATQPVTQLTTQTALPTTDNGPLTTDNKPQTTNNKP